MISCPACGRASRIGRTRCSQCGAPLVAGTGLDETAVPGQHPRHDEELTGAAGPAAGASTGSEHDHTMLVDEPGGGAPPASTPGGEGPLAVGLLFGDRYTIVRLLGVGGMGAVYEAVDEKVGIRVALKVVRPQGPANHELTLQLDRRFRRELILARQVTHRNVVRIHDLGEIDGIKYITMTYIEGESLAAMLDRRDRLPVEEALPILRGVLSGLVEAHQAGVVHRDLKPANIMVEAGTGTPLIMDFGIARSSEREDGDEAVRLAREAIGESSDGGDHHHETRAGDVVGTLQYMPPEQLYGRAVDQRADIYALGLMLYDMLLGRAERGKGTDTAIAELKRRLETPPPSPRSLDPTIPETVDRIVMRCLQPDPEDRYTSSAELAAELARLDDRGVPLPVERRLTRRTVAAAAAVVALALAGTWWVASRRAPPVEHEPMTVLIADLVNRTGDPSFEGAVEQAMTIALEGAPFVSAFSRPSALRIAQRLEPDSRLDETMARLVSRREGVSAIISSTLSSEGGSFVLSVTALDPGLEPGEGRPLGTARTVARNRDEVLSAVARAAAEIRGELGDTTPSSDRLAASETFTAASLEAMRAYARGQDLATQGRFEEALSAYGEAVEEDPDFGRAWAGMGVVHGNLRQTDLAEEAFQRALANLDRMSERERYRTLGGYYLLVSRNYAKAIENYSTLVELYPADRAGYTNLSFAYLNVRDFDRAMEVGRQAVEIEPSSVIKRMNYAMYAMYAGDFDTAIAESRRVLEKNPSFGYALFTIGRAAGAAGDMTAAHDAYEELASGDGMGTSLAPMAHGDLALYRGRSRDAVRLLEPAVAGSANAFEKASMLVALAEARLLLGNAERAASEALQAVELSDHEAVRYFAARVLLAAGRGEEAEAIAVDLENRLQSLSTCLAGLIRAERALGQGQLGTALRELRWAREEYDFWMVHYLAGLTYMQAEQYPEAFDEFDHCVRRKGEATDVFLVDGATLRIFPPALYWLGRAHEALGNPDAARELYEEYVEIRGTAEQPDPLAADAAARIGPS